MKYDLINGQPKEIKRLVLDGIIYTNPSDSLLEANNIGYSREIVAPPELTDETKKLTHTYAIIEGAITDVWTVVDKTPEELIDMYIDQITTIYNTAEDYKNDGKILYPVTGKEYIPRWVFEFYNTALINKDSYFPTAESTIEVTAVDGSSDEMTFSEFVQLYGFLIGSYMTYTAVQNGDIKTLTDKIKELRNEPVEEPEESPETETEEPEGETVEEPIEEGVGEPE